MIRTWHRLPPISIKSDRLLRLPTLASSCGAPTSCLNSPSPWSLAQSRFRHHAKYQKQQLRNLSWQPRQQQEQITYAGEKYQQYQQHPPQVKYLRPAIWVLVVSGSICIGLAYLEAKKQTKARVSRSSSAWSLVPNWSALLIPSAALTFIGVNQLWNAWDPMRKLSTGIITSCLLVHGTSFLLPQFWTSLWHVPARNVNHTLFTSVFVHSGGLHLFFNMYFLHNFIQPVGYSRAFEGSSYHILSFFLSTGLLTSFAEHWASRFFNRPSSVPSIFVSSGGASGALFALLGVFCTQYPDARLGIIFIPVHFEAPYFLSVFMAFDFIGLLRGGYSFLPLCHAAHLSGALIGVGYTYLDGKERIWNPLVNFWKRRLEASG